MSGHVYDISKCMLGRIFVQWRPDEIVFNGAMDIEKLRLFVRTYIEKHQYESALFWADKVVTLSNGEVGDVYWLAQCLYLTGQYHRASHLLKSKNLHKTQKACCYLIAKCHAAVKEWEEALDILDATENNAKTPSKNKRFSIPMADEESEQTAISMQNVESSICLLRGQIFEAMENWALATENYREALRRDVYCFEAFELLMKHQMLTAEEEKEFMKSLHMPFSQQCPEEEADTVKNIYLLILKKYDRPSESSMPKCLAPLGTNLDVVTNQAERHYYNCDFRTCYKITTDVLNKDPYHASCLPLHIAVLVEVKKSNELFYLAHKLVDLYPNKPIAWFAVGCYYYLVGKNEPARRFFSKATTLDRLYGPAWLAFGHSFAAEGEHDQAMAAYFKASQVMKGCHLPLLFVGLEHGQTKNFRLAEKFFSQALAIAPNDPFVLHEMGVAAFHNADWETAEKYFTDALNIVQTMGPHALTEKWESLLNNMGHVSRKLKKYEQALDYHRQALVLCPQNSSTFSAMGYVYSLMGDFSMAIDYFHKALGVGRDDTFSVTMLAHAIEQYICEMSPCEGADTAIPELMDAPLLSKEHESSVPGTPRDTPVTELIDAPHLTMEMENSMNTTKDDTSSSIDIEVEMEDND